MTRRVGEKSAIAAGLNSSIEFSGQTYHVQTQCSKRDAPIIESLVYQGGQTLVRFTASYDDIASRYGFSGDDGRHLLQIQHANLIQKIRHGLLRDNAEERGASPDHEEARLVDAEGVVIHPSEVDDPSVVELLQELGVAVDEARPEEPPRPDLALPTRIPPRAPSLSLPARPWRRRMAIVIRLRRRTSG